ncbi:restriction endonuclease type II-like protein [Flagelloscypha sp. PMI_526]|nr:restriction endonuclease type II-like protein [Flagelloscypha sp. PMI_526]
MASSNVNKPPAPPVILPSGSVSGNNILVHPSQKANPIRDYIKNVGQEFAEILVDYQVGKTAGVLYLSLKYHKLHPEYIATRIEKLGTNYSLRILLILSDISEHRDPIRELTKICLINEITIIVAFSLKEAGHYLATFKQFEHKAPDLIKERVDKDYPSMLRNALTSINKVNKTDVETLRASFGSFSGIARASPEQLQSLPGFGNVKVKNIKTAFDKPIRHAGTDALRDVAAQASEISTVQTNAVEKTTPGTSTPNSNVAVPMRPPREPSPEWDIEKEDGVLPDEPFDIELDLN